MVAVRDQIATRVLAPGDRAPSVRSFAQAMRVSPSTVVEAYDRLEAEGVLKARRGSGFYVTGTPPTPMKLSAPGSPRSRGVDPFWVSRQMLDAEPGTLQPGCGWLPESWMPHAALSKGMRSLARGDQAVLANYASTRGAHALRRHLLSRFAAEELPVAPERLMLTASASQALDLICRLMLRPGDTVLVDDPGYFNFHALLRAHQLQVVGVPYAATGPDLAAFETALVVSKPRLYVTNSALHNPTGATISPHTAHHVLSLARTHQLTIVEDDTFSDLEPEPSTRLAVLDGLDSVIRIGGFSKTISASMRCGYIAACANWIEALVDLQIATCHGGPSPFAAELIAELLTSGGYRKHLSELNRRLAAARKSASDELAAIGITPWIMPRGGFLLWGRFPENVDSTEVALRCREVGILTAPGNVFSPTQTATAFMRFNVSQLGDRRVIRALRDAMNR